MDLPSLDPVILLIVYSVCNQIGTVFGGDVVLDSFNMAYRDEESNLDQEYEKQSSWIFIKQIFNFRTD